MVITGVHGSLLACTTITGVPCTLYLSPWPLMCAAECAHIVYVHAQMARNQNIHFRVHGLTLGSVVSQMNPRHNPTDVAR
jgi:hypothetical protein